MSFQISQAFLCVRRPGDKLNLLCASETEVHGWPCVLCMWMAPKSI